jgi:hypothetical protein
MKDMWILAYEDLIEEYTLENPECTEDEAEQYAEKHVNERYKDYVADLIDQARERAKDAYS